MYMYMYVLSSFPNSLLSSQPQLIHCPGEYTVYIYTCIYCAVSVVYNYYTVCACTVHVHVYTCMHMYMYVQLTAYPTPLIYYEEKYAGRKGRKEEEEGRRRDDKSNILTVYSQTYMYTLIMPVYTSACILRCGWR